MRSTTSPAVSASTRELMDFLAEGPPDVPKMSAGGRDMVDFLAQGPPDQGNNGVENGKKGSGRLQRMMSKLSMGTGERSRSQPSEDFGRGNKGFPPTTPVRTTGVAHQTSYGNLANRPVPPRMPPAQPISPPSSPSEEDYSSARSRKGSVTQPGQPRRTMPTWEQQMADGQTPPTVPGKAEHVENGGTVNGASVNGNGHRANGYAKIGNGAVVDEQAASRTRRPSAGASDKPRAKPAVQTVPGQASPTTTRKPAAPSPPVAAPPFIAEDHARDMRRLLAKATNADECRLIFEMFLAKAGVALEPATYDVPYPSPSLSDAHAASTRDSSEVALELSLVELFLGGGSIEEQPAPKKRRSKKKAEEAPAATTPAPAPVPTPAVAEIPAPTPTHSLRVHAEPRKYTPVATPEASTASTRTHTPTTVSGVGA
jgi:hypothetical protein